MLRYRSFNEESCFTSAFSSDALDILLVYQDHRHAMAPVDFRVVHITTSNICEQTGSFISLGCVAFGVP